MLDKDPWLLRLAIGLDQLLNAILGGDIDETLSSRTYRRARGDSKGWKRTEQVIDRLFFLQAQHCRESYLDERRRRKRWLELYDDHA